MTGAKRIMTWMLALAIVFSMTGISPKAAMAADGGSAAIKDGVYSVKADVINDMSGGYSMGNGALRGSGSNSDKDYYCTLIVKNGKGTLVAEFVPLLVTAYNQTGFLMGLTKVTSGINNPVTISEYLKTDGSVVYDTNNDPQTGVSQAKGKAYPHHMAIDVGTLPADGKTIESTSALPRYQVFVPTMEAMSSGSGTQFARIRVDYSNIKDAENLSTDVPYWTYMAMSAAKGVASDSDYKAMQDLAKDAQAKLSKTTLTLTYADNGEFTHEKQEMTKAEKQELCRQLQTAYEKTLSSSQLSEELDTAKQEAISAIESFRDPANYDDAQKAEIAAIVSKAKDDIGKATTSNEVSQILDNAKAELAAIKTSLEVKQDTAVSELESYKDPADYLEKEQAQLATIVEDGIKAIREAKTAAEVDSALAAAKKKADGLTTAAQYNDKATTEQKNAAISELENYKDRSLYREAEQAQLDSAIANGKTAIKRAISLTDMNNALENAKKAIDEIKTDAQYKEEEMAAAIEKAKALADGTYSVQIEMIRADDRSRYSMSHEAVDKTLYIQVEGGEYSAVMSFTGLTILGQKGYLKDLSYYDSGYTFTEYGTPSGMVKSAEPLTAQKTAEGKPFGDYFNDADEDGYVDFLYPAKIRVPLVDKGSKEYVPLQVFVPVMEDIQAGSGTQPVMMKIDWTTLKEAAASDMGLAEPSSSELDAAVTKAGALKQSDYSADSWKNFQRALSAAKNVSGEAATQFEYDSAQAALEKAEAGLVKNAPAKDPAADKAAREAAAKKAAYNKNVKAAKVKKTAVKAKALKKKKANVTWKKVAGVTGYEVYRSMKKNRGFKKIATVKGAKKAKFVSKKLKAKKKYFFKVRPYTVVKDPNGKNVTVFGKWSNTAKVKARK